jgi:hypothetical protein
MHFEELLLELNTFWETVIYWTGFWETVIDLSRF